MFRTRMIGVFTVAALTFAVSIGSSQVSEESEPVTDSYGAFVRFIRESTETTKKRIEGRCADKWSDDFVMRRYCERKQMGGIISFLEVSNTLEIKELRASFLECLDEGNDGPPDWAFDWVVVSHCYRWQVDSYFTRGEFP